MNLKLNSLSPPQGAGPIKFNSDFGDTAALMLTVASPLEDPTAIAVLAYAIETVLKRVRKERRGKSQRVPVSLVLFSPLTDSSARGGGKKCAVFVQSTRSARSTKPSEIGQWSRILRNRWIHQKNGRRSLRLHQTLSRA